MPSLPSAMAVSRSLMDRSRDFFLSSAASNSFAQYSFLASSSACSVFRVTTISSIILITVSKPIFFPWIANAMKSICGLLECAPRSSSRARALIALDVTCTCTRKCLLEELEGIIVIQDFDCVCQCCQLFIASLDYLIPLCSLLSTIFLHISQEFLVLSQSLGSVFKVIFLLCNLHSKFPNPCH